jgi:type II secretory pathway component PulC
VVVESITNGGSELKPGDIVVMVEEKPITSLNVLNKIMKCNQSCLRFKVERKLKSTTIADENKVV